MSAPGPQSSARPRLYPQLYPHPMIARTSTWPAADRPNVNPFPINAMHPAHSGFAHTGCVAQSTAGRGSSASCPILIDSAVVNEPVPNGSVPYGPVPYGPVPYGPVQYGPVQYGPVQYGPVQNGHVQNGHVQNGPVRNGPVQNSPVQNGPAQNSPAQNSPVQNGHVQNGHVQNGHVQNGHVQNGPVQNGPVQKDPIQKGPVQKDPIQKGPIQNSSVLKSSAVASGFVLNSSAPQHSPVECTSAHQSPRQQEPTKKRTIEADDDSEDEDAPLAKRLTKDFKRGSFGVAPLSTVLNHDKSATAVSEQNPGDSLVDPVPGLQESHNVEIDLDDDIWSRGPDSATTPNFSMLPHLTDSDSVTSESVEVLDRSTQEPTPESVSSLSSAKSLASPSKSNQRAENTDKEDDGSKSDSSSGSGSSSISYFASEKHDDMRCRTCKDRLPAYYGVTTSKKQQQGRSAACIECRAPFAIQMHLTDGRTKPLPTGQAELTEAVNEAVDKYFSKWEEAVEKAGFNKVHRKAFVELRKVSTEAIMMWAPKYIPNAKPKIKPKSSLQATATAATAKTTKDDTISKTTSSTDINPVTEGRNADVVCAVCHEKRPAYFYMAMKRKGLDSRQRCIECRGPDRIVRLIREKRVDSSEHPSLVDEYFEKWKGHVENARPEIKIPECVLSALRATTLQRAQEILTAPMQPENAAQGPEDSLEDTVQIVQQSQPQQVDSSNGPENESALSKVQEPSSEAAGQSASDTVGSEITQTQTSSEMTEYQNQVTSCVMDLFALKPGYLTAEEIEHCKIECLQKFRKRVQHMKRKAEAIKMYSQKFDEEEGY